MPGYPQFTPNGLPPGHPHGHPQMFRPVPGGKLVCFIFIGLLDQTSRCEVEFKVP